MQITRKPGRKALFGDVAIAPKKVEQAGNLLRNAPIPMSVMDPEGRRISTSLATEKLFNRKEEEILGARVEELYSSEDIGRIRNAMQESKEVGFSTCEATCIRGDGSTFPAILTFSAVRDEKGNVTNILEVAQNITESRKKENELKNTIESLSECKRNLEKLENLIELSPAIMNEWGPDGKVYKANAAYARLIGYSKEELYTSGWKSWTPEEYDKPDESYIRHMIETGEEEPYYEKEFTRKDGKRITISAINKPLFKEDGSFDRFIGWGQDITEAKNREMKLKNAISLFGKVLASASQGDLTAKVDLAEISEEYKPIGEDLNKMVSDVGERERELVNAKAYTDAIIKNMPGLFAVVDRNNIWVVASPYWESATGYKLEEIVGKHITKQPFNYPEVAEFAEQLDKRVRAGEVIRGIEARFRHADGTGHIGTITMSQLKDAQGNDIGTIWYAKDVTEMKKATAEVAEALSAVSEGDLTRKVDVSGLTGDLREMGEDVNKSIDTLHTLIKQTKEGAETVSSTAQSLSASAEELNASTEQISSAVAQIAQGATSQAKQVEETREAATNLKMLSQRGASEAESAARAASETMKVAMMGAEATKDAVSKTREIINTTNDSAAAVKKLGQMIEEIGIMVDVITNIADQTNLLSLNAAIEAARAGEQGRAFAVVAEEVKKLAEGSRGSAGKIAATVKAIESERAKAISSMDVSLKEVTEGEEVINKSLSALDDIAKLVQETAGMSQRILAASQEEKEAIERITKAIDGIGTVAEQTAASAQESAASTEEETASMEELTSTAQGLANMADNLNKAIAKFKVME